MNLLWALIQNCSCCCYYVVCNLVKLQMGFCHFVLKSLHCVMVTVVPYVLVTTSAVLSCKEWV